MTRITSTAHHRITPSIAKAGIASILPVPAQSGKKIPASMVRHITSPD